MEIKDIKVATIKNVCTAFCQERRSLKIYLSFVGEKTGCHYILDSDDNNDMEILANLMSYTKSGGSVLELEGKEVRIIFKENFIFAIGHPAEDKFIRIRRHNGEIPLSEIVKEFNLN